MFDDGPRLYLATSALALAIFSCYRKYWDKQSGPPLPPGPIPLPIVGNVLSLDTTQPWLTFNAWKSIYGDIIYARLLNKPVVVINSEEVAKDLFEGRSTIYSDRPQSIVTHTSLRTSTQCSCHMETGGASTDEFFIRHFVKLKYPLTILCSYVPPTKCCSVFYRTLAAIQDIWRCWLQRSALLPAEADFHQDDPIARNMKRYLNRTNTALTPGVTVILETFPFLLKLPSWFPGATFKRASLECLEAGHDIKEIPFQMVEERMSTDITVSCFVADTLSRMKLFEEDDAVITTAVKEAACMAFAAAFETTTSTLLMFILAIVLNPEVQAKAQAEIDRFVGKDRLPDFNDRPSLPYVDAVLREILRWHPVVPFGVPRTTTTSDIYKGYFIPKGVVLFANAWAMTHDEKKYPSPDEFKPERFLHEDGSLTSDTMPLGFGWGRSELCGTVCRGYVTLDRDRELPRHVLSPQGP